MKALTKKLLRDLLHMRGQALAIALVVAAGVAVFISMFGALDSLTRSRDAFYESSRFADVFAQARRAPVSVADRIADIKGVARVMTRVTAEVTIDLPGIDDPIVGHVVSIEPDREPLLNALHLRSGRIPIPGRDNEVLVSEAFAKARSLALGDRFSMVLNGRRRDVVLSGVALSPEYIFQLGNGGQLLPDDARFGIVWMTREPLAAALDMQGVTNDFSIALDRGANEADVIFAIDRILAPYGTPGAFGRSKHPSHSMLSEELKQLSATATFVPAIFLAVAAFLLNVVMTRTVQTERTQIATLKAFGYTPFEIARHYLELSLVLAGLGALLGIALGAALGEAMLGMYADYYRFPLTPLTITARSLTIAVGVTLASAAVGALGAVRKAAREAPAEAMKPEPPARFSPTLLERIGVGKLLSPAGRMVLRNMARRPWRAAFSILGMSFAGAILVVGTFSVDAFEYVLEVQFSSAQTEDATVAFVRSVPDSAVIDVKHLPGVLRAEPMRSVGVTLRHGPKTWRTAITGLRRDGELRRLVDDRRTVHPIPPSGLALGKTVAAKIDARVGDHIEVEPLEGDRTRRTVVVSTVFDEVIGGSVVMDLPELYRLLGEGRVVTGALVSLDRNSESAFHQRVKRLPAISGVSMRRNQLESFDRMMDETMGVMRTIQILLAAIIAFAVVYNNARIALAERSRELASLRVLGFTRQEVSRILLGEMLVATTLSIPLGLLLGYGMSASVVSQYATELFRIPLIVSGSTYAVAALTVAVSAALSALIVRRRIDHLDLVGVLKTRD